MLALVDGYEIVTKPTSLWCTPIDIKCENYYSTFSVHMNEIPIVIESSKFQLQNFYQQNPYMVKNVIDTFLFSY